MNTKVLNLSLLESLSYSNSGYVKTYDISECDINYKIYIQVSCSDHGKFWLEKNKIKRIDSSKIEVKNKNSKAICRACRIRKISFYTENNMLISEIYVPSHIGLRPKDSISIGEKLCAKLDSEFYNTFMVSRGISSITLNLKNR